MKLHDQLDAEACLPPEASDRRGRVLMFVPQYPYPVVGGLEKQSHELAKALLVAGNSVRVLSGKTSRDQGSTENVEGVTVYRIPWPTISAVRAFVLPWFIIASMVRNRQHYDVVHVHQHSWISILVLTVSKLMRKKTIAKLSNVAELGLPGMGRGRFGAAKRRLFLSADAIIAMSRQSVDELADRSYPLKRTFQTPNGIFLDQIARKPKKCENVCRVVYVGRLSEEKQLDKLIELWPKVLRSSTSSVELHIWGDGPDAEKLQSQVAILELQHSVSFAGHVENVRGRLRDMDIFILPSRVEGNSNAILEAMAAELPVVSTTVGGTPMQVGKCGARFLSSPTDFDRMSQNLIDLICDHDLRVKTGQQMRARAERYFDITKISTAYSCAYKLLSAGLRDRIAELANPVVSEEL